ncbi:hypothetical protein SH528x_003834 [Novipirellula sp. SH528]|uniref:hypothetical protein n=1 Tax=Novipirellula sp. SH528 TaxID=3454466 RepID=UPI003FA0D2D1
MLKKKIFLGIASLVRNGYRPAYNGPQSVRFFSRDGSETLRCQPWAVPNVSRASRAILFVLPTMRERSSKAISSMIRVMASQVAEAQAEHVDCDIAMIIGLQWKLSKDENRGIDHLLSMLSTCDQDKTHVSGLLLNGFRKADTLNAVIENTQNISAIGWVDDDVSLEPNCISQLVEEWKSVTHPCAVGAKKIGSAHGTTSGRALKWAKEFTRPAMNYPHGCCILVSFPVLRNGIPLRYVSDDGFVCFELLRPISADPMDRLIISSKAVCRFTVGVSTFGGNVRRIRRILMNHAVFLADYPYEKSMLYMQNCLFWGLWPLAPIERPSLRLSVVIRWALKLLYFVFFCVVVLEIILRGIIGRPRRVIPW